MANTCRDTQIAARLRVIAADYFDCAGQDASGRTQRKAKKNVSITVQPRQKPSPINAARPAEIRRNNGDRLGSGEKGRTTTRSRGGTHVPYPYAQ